jgi:probable HAF family extracellular repeat protein
MTVCGVAALVSCRDTTAPSSLPAVTVRSTSYTATPLGPAIGIAVAINEAGRVAGTRGIRHGEMVHDHAFVWYKGTTADLAERPGGGSLASDINNRGQVVGTSPTSGDPESGFPHAVLWDRSDIVDLGALPGAVYSESRAYAINERGQVAGVSSSAIDFGNDHAVVWERGVIRDLGAPPGGASSAFGINDRGDAVGSSQGYDAYPRATLWTKGTVTDVGLIPGADYSLAIDINNRGQVVGESGRANYSEWTHAFTWERGVMTDLGTLPGGLHSSATGINAAGQVVGSSDDDKGETHAVIWQDGVIRDIGIGRAAGINDRGEVVGETNAGPTLWTVK